MRSECLVEARRVVHVQVIQAAAHVHIVIIIIAIVHIHGHVKVGSPSLVLSMRGWTSIPTT